MFVFSNLFKVMEIYEIYTKSDALFVPLSHVLSAASKERLSEATLYISIAY
jgi:hypothetical protein